MRCWRFTAALLLVLSWSGEALRASSVPERELVLFMDASVSMYPPRSSHSVLQRDGYLAALRDPEVQTALLVAPTVVRVVYFGGTGRVRYAFDPMHVRDVTDIEFLAGLIEAEMPQSALQNGTDQCAAIMAVMSTDRMGLVRIYDLVTDEVLFTQGSELCQKVRNQAEHYGDEINVLAIGRAAGPYERGKFIANLITQIPRGFFMEAASWEDFAAAIKRKLLQELHM